MQRRYFLGVWYWLEKLFCNGQRREADCMIFSYLIIQLELVFKKNCPYELYLTIKNVKVVPI